MRLIDADKLKQSVTNEMIKAEQNSPLYCTLECVIADIDGQPTAYDVDRVVEQLEQQKNQYFRRAEEIKNKFGENYESQKNYGKACSYDHAIEIVKSVGTD